MFSTTTTTTTVTTAAAAAAAAATENGEFATVCSIMYRKWGFLVSYSVCFCCDEDDDDGGRGFRLIRFLLLEP